MRPLPIDLYEQDDTIEAVISATAIAYGAMGTDQTPPVDLKPAAKAANNPTYSLGKGDGFPTERRPEIRPLTEAAMPLVDAWFTESEITIGAMADTADRMEKVKRLLYTYRDCFAVSLRDIKPTDLIEHSIDLEPNAKPVKGSLPKYTTEEREFANQIFPELEDAGIITRRSSPWGVRTKFPPKKKGSNKKRVVHNFIPVNRWTIKSAYPMHRLEEVVDALIKEKFKVYFSTDAANGYWAILIIPKDRNKTGFITPNGQWVYNRMGQGLKGAPHTYAQFTDLVFGPLPANAEGVPRMPSIIDTYEKSAFRVFMDDHAGSATDYDTMFEFLSTKYFPRVAFGPVYLAGAKTFVFTNQLDVLGFQGSADGIRPSIKHREKVENWPTPTNRAELDAFLWLTPFLRIFIPGRAEHVLNMKLAYLHLVPAEPKLKQTHDAEVEDCDADLTKVIYPTRTKKPTIRTKYIEKDTFDWGPLQQQSFEAVKKAIATNAMAGADPTLQYHLVVDGSDKAVGGVLFQLYEQPPGTEADARMRPNERIIMFLSFRLNDAETRYVNSERECLAVVRCLAEVRWLVMGSPYPTMIYSDHQALKSIMSTGQTEVGRISSWLDRLGEYDYKLVYRASRDQHIGIADGLSRMPTRLTSKHSAVDEDRIAMALTMAEDEPLAQHTFPRSITGRIGSNLDKFEVDPMYHQLMAYLARGEDAMENLGLPKNRRRYLRTAAKDYRMPGPDDPQVLMFVEANGVASVCVTELEKSRWLMAAHEDHGHHSPSLTLDYLIGRAYWPTRVKDVHAWCQSCHACQLRMKKPIKIGTQSIQEFKPMSMVGMDWIGPITPACTATGAKYVLLVVDYFTRFVWGKAYREHTSAEVVDMYENTIAPIFGWPEGVYSDNGSHFVNELVRTMFASHGTKHFTGPVSHPSSTGLLERTVQETMSWSAKKCIERGNTDSWSLSLRECFLYLNTKAVRIHGYTPATLMLGFDPQLFHFDINPYPIPPPNEIDIDQPAHQLQVYAALRSENRLLANEAASYTHYHRGAKARKQRIPAPGDLVIVRNHAVDAQRSRKLEGKWLGPRLLTRTAKHGLSGYVRELHGDGRERRYHMNDLLLYHAREPVVTAGATLICSPHGTSPAVISASRTSNINQGGRAIFLQSYWAH